MTGNEIVERYEKQSYNDPNNILYLDEMIDEALDGVRSETAKLESKVKQLLKFEDEENIIVANFADDFENAPTMEQDDQKTKILQKILQELREVQGAV